MEEFIIVVGICFLISLIIGLLVTVIVGCILPFLFDEPKMQKKGMIFVDITLRISLGAFFILCILSIIDFVIKILTMT